MSAIINLLIKVFDKEEYADAFIREGEMFCRALGEFKKIENDDQRADIHEGVTAWLQPDQIKLTISYKDSDGVENSFLVEGLASPFVIGDRNYDQWNLYCMYAVKAPEFEESYETEEEKLRIFEKINKLAKESITLGKEILDLGEFAVIIHRIDSFIDKVRQAGACKRNCGACKRNCVIPDFLVTGILEPVKETV